MASATEKFTPFIERMRAEALPDIAIETFEYYFMQLIEGQTGLISEDDITPVESLPYIEDFSEELAAIGQGILCKTVLLKLNGGLGTGMGLDNPKSLLTVINNLSFLDIIARQAQQAGMPLVLMNSFSTRDESLTALKDYPKLWSKIPLDFLQHKVPKITQADLSPVVWSRDPSLEWCPPGHGDIYAALVTSGMLDILLHNGYEYAFVSNVDNLGAVMNTTILGYFAQNKLPFLMEVADRTAAERKGGHLAQLSNGQLILRESAQCSPEDERHFQDIKRHGYFNTNNLWVHLPTLKTEMGAKDNILGLPMIRNSKNVDPRDSFSTDVYQLETAMGAAISIFKGSAALRVPRTRLAPVKTTADLLTVRSDAYTLTNSFQVISNPERELEQILINLDDSYYKLIDDLEARFPSGPPSLVGCQRLSIEGDVKIGSNVTITGTVNLINESGQQVAIEDDVIIDGVRRWPN